MPGREISRILRVLADRADCFEDKLPLREGMNYQRIMDINDNTVGEVKVTK